MKDRIEVNVSSEIGELEAVIIHTPGPEVENMTPENAERALYSDILNLSVVTKEYREFHKVLSRYAKTFEIRDLLLTVLDNSTARETLLDQLCQECADPSLRDQLSALSNEELTRQLVEGVPLKKDNLTKFLSRERYALQPLHNFFFTRDAAVTVNRSVIISSLARQVREPEALIMRTIFENHPLLKAETLPPPRQIPNRPKISIEGGDILVARDDVMVIGVGARTTSEGVDHILDALKVRGERMHILVQELPHEPESFIHLDMVFTFLDVDTCLIYEPVILNPHDFPTVHIELDNGAVTSISEEEDLLSGLGKIGIEVSPISCGGDTDPWTQEREQWHSGANFFAMAPGKVMGYGRNVYTLEAMQKRGFEILSGRDVLKGTKCPEDYKRYAITLEGAELSRGGGGCRCMTMPISRKPLI